MSGGRGGAVVAGATHMCDRYVSILTGPVVGLATGDTARILLKEDRTAEITSLQHGDSATELQGKRIEALASVEQTT